MLYIFVSFLSYPDDVFGRCLGPLPVTTGQDDPGPPPSQVQGCGFSDAGVCS